VDYRPHSLEQTQGRVPGEGAARAFGTKAVVRARLGRGARGCARRTHLCSKGAAAARVRGSGGGGRHHQPPRPPPPPRRRRARPRPRCGRGPLDAPPHHRAARLQGARAAAEGWHRPRATSLAIFCVLRLDWLGNGPSGKIGGASCWCRDAAEVDWRKGLAFVVWLIWRIVRRCVSFVCSAWFDALNPGNSRRPHSRAPSTTPDQSNNSSGRFQ
jgi:hypothetical protein